MHPLACPEGEICRMLHHQAQHPSRLMTRLYMRIRGARLIQRQAIAYGVFCFFLLAVSRGEDAPAPQVMIPTVPKAQVSAQRSQSTHSPAVRVIYPWKLRVTCTVFWIGEQPSDRNPTPNDKSSWDGRWAENFGGYDDPEPSRRVANHSTGEFRPKGFVPKLNPFYVALPYNDIVSHMAHKPEAVRVIPWFSRLKPEPGKTVCKGRWIQIHRNGRDCYAQWEDCGPWTTDDWEFVFGDKPPKNKQNGEAALDISPAIRDYLAIDSGQKVHWRFVEASQVPNGPWKKYGPTPVEVPILGSILDKERRFIERLRLQRDAYHLNKPLDR